MRGGECELNIKESQCENMKEKEKRRDKGGKKIKQHEK